MKYQHSPMKKIRQIHFIGIGGTGMNGIAEVLLNQGFIVTGSDVTENGAVQRLSSLGAKIVLGHAAENVVGADAIVISSAIKKNNSELIAAQEARLPIIPRAEMLAELMRFCYGIAVAGTHGKTTTTSLVASILAEAGFDPTYVIGGRLNSSGTNAKLGESQYFVAEADESDASFLHLKPMISIVTNIDLDHMENYDGDVERLYSTFLQFLHHLPFYGKAILCLDDVGVQKILAKVTRPIITYGLTDAADLYATDIKYVGMKTYFTLHRPDRSSLALCSNLPGRHNVLNALSAIAVALELEVPDEAIVNALQKFAGVGRRCQILGEFKMKNGTVMLMDDYGHHPREIAATQQAIKAAYPDRRLVTVFQPHRYSRTKSLFEDFAQVLSETDLLLLLEIYSAGEEPLSGIDTRTLFGNIRQRKKVDPIFVEEQTQLIEILQSVTQENDIVLMQGAGNIGSLVQQLAKTLPSA